MSLPEDLSLNCRNIMFLRKVLNLRPGAKIKFIREATESAQPDWELDVQQRSYFVLITIVSIVINFEGALIDHQPCFIQNLKLLAVQEPGFLKSKFGQNRPLTLY